MEHRKLKKIVLSLVLIISLSFLIPLYGNSWEKVKNKIDSLVQRERFGDAEAYCRKWSSKKRQICYRYLLEAYLNAGHYDRALQTGNNIEFAGKDVYPRLYAQIGRAYSGLKNYAKAAQYFDRQPDLHYGERARAYGMLADRMLQTGDRVSARTYYEKAVQEYEHILKHFFYPWTVENNKDLRRCIRTLEGFEKSAEEKAGQAVLAKLLNGAADYCDKMKKSAFHFFCKEKVFETLDLYNESVLTNGQRLLSSTPEKNQPMKNSFVYEYQLLQEGKKIEESRRLIRQNGVKKDVPDAQLTINGCKYEKLIFGPIELISRSRQRQYHYRLLREEELWGEPAAVIEAIPLYSLYQRFGKIWVSKTDFSVMKIEWNPKSISLYRLIEDRAKRFNAEPQIAFYAEFETKKRGIRFPSGYFLEETYVLTKNKKKYERLNLNVGFEEYLFFVVASEVVESKPGVWQ